MTGLCSSTQAPQARPPPVATAASPSAYPTTSEAARQTDEACGAPPGAQASRRQWAQDCPCGQYAACSQGRLAQNLVHLYRWRLLKESRTALPNSFKNRDAISVSCAQPPITTSRSSNVTGSTATGADAASTTLPLPRQATDQILLPLADELEALNEPYRLVTGNELTGEIGAPYFTAAVYASRCVLLNPAALCRGLADMLPHNVVHYEKIPVTGIDYSGGLTLTAAQGENRAPRMILTVNGCAQQFGFFQRRLLSFAVPASLSRPLTQDECKALGGKNEWGLTATHGYVGTTMRMTHDQRILIRQNVRLCPGMNDSDAKRQVIGREHKKLLDQRFPMLPNVTMEHTWTGYVCASRNGSPGCGRIARTPIPPSARTAAASREAPSQASWRPTGHAWSTTRLSPRSRSRARQTGCRRARSSMWAFTPSWHGIVTCIVTRCDMIFCCAVPTGNPSREREP